jgi:hypothetical protein
MFQTSSGPKNVEVINKTDEIYWEYCAPSWFHLQDYIEKRGQQNLKFIIGDFYTYMFIELLLLNSGIQWA